jgi:hypothetical protein
MTHITIERAKLEQLLDATVELMRPVNADKGNHDGWDARDVRRWNAAIKNTRKALAPPTPVQEPVAWPEHEFIQWGAKKYGPLVQAAINLLAEIDSNHDSKSYPHKYGVPYGAVNTLRNALTAAPLPQPSKAETAAPSMDAMVNRFLTWPVPASVYPDGTPGQPGRTGTNLLSAPEARQMLEHVVGIPPAAPVQPAPKNAGAAKMPCGAVVSNVYDAYEAGKKAARLAVPLTDEQIEEAVRNWHGTAFTDPEDEPSLIEIARAIEAAHGITEKGQP